MDFAALLIDHEDPFVCNAAVTFAVGLKALCEVETFKTDEFATWLSTMEILVTVVLAFSAHFSDGLLFLVMLLC